ncbi:hypothetical protein SASC598O02_000040, partial [Snodgrassella alvi SCGC AB-598-O02]
MAVVTYITRVTGYLWLILSLVIFSIMPAESQNLLIFVLPPLALTGAAQLNALRTGAVAFLNWFGI